MRKRFERQQNAEGKKEHDLRMRGVWVRIPALFKRDFGQVAHRASNLSFLPLQGDDNSTYPKGCCGD